MIPPGSTIGHFGTTASPRDWTAWGGSPSGTGFRTLDQAGFSADQIPDLELRWVTRSQPSVIGNQVIVGTQFGEVYSLDAKSGCIQWTYEAEAGIKGVVAVSAPSTASCGNSTRAGWPPGFSRRRISSSER